jgi:2,3-bisphosphoglycerate-dependent phosphoglycerate mutase
VTAAPAARTVAEYHFMLPPDATEIFIVRHGASADAVPGEPYPFAGKWSDPELSPAGREQAERIADRLAHEPIAAIYVSDLRRTQQTAAPLAARLGMTPTEDAGIREVYMGEWEGYVWRQRIEERDPLALQMIDEQRWDIIPGAEDPDGFAARVRAALARIADRHRGETIAVFTHGGVIGQVVGDAVGSLPYPFNASDNGAIAQLVRTSTRWKVRRFNDTTHLHPRFTLAGEPLT